MNVNIVRDNLKKTIAGKEQLLAEYKKAQISANGAEDIVIYSVVRFLETNLEELNKILADVSKCCEQYDFDSWTTNPDRMGGQYTQEEIDRSDRWV